MEKIENQTEKSDFKSLKERIIRRIKTDNAAKLSELIKLGKSRNAVIYHIRRLCEANEIYAFIVGNGLDDDGIFYSMASGGFPTEIHRIEELIDIMCDKNRRKALMDSKKKATCNDKTSTATKDNEKTAEEAYEEFLLLCAKKGIYQSDSKMMATALISHALPGLKEKVTFHLMIVKNESRELIDAGYAKASKSEGPRSGFMKLLEGLNL